MGALACAFGLVSTPGPAAAEVIAPRAAPPPPPAKTSLYRQGRGWFVGGDVGFTVVSYATDNGSASETGFYLVARFGGMLGERLALSAEFWTDGHSYQDFSGAASTQNTLALTATYWLMPKLWMSSGLGSSTAKGFVDGELQWEEEGFSMLAGMSYAIVNRPRWSIELSSRVITSWYEPFHRTASLFGIGGSWH